MAVCKKYVTPDKKLFTNSWLGGSMVSRLYLSYRWLVSAFCLATLVHSFVYRARTSGEDIHQPAAKYWIYLTTWARIMALTAHTVDAALVTQRWRRELDGQIEVSTRYPSNSQKSLPLSHQTLWVLSNINSVLSAMVAIIYWGFVYEPQRNLLNFENFSGHCLILTVNIIDIFISARPWRCLHAYHTMVFSVIYVLFNFTYIKLGGTNPKGKHYIYSILNWNKPVEYINVVADDVFVHYILMMRTQARFYRIYIYYISVAKKCQFCCHFPIISDMLSFWWPSNSSFCGSLILGGGDK